MLSQYLHGREPVLVGYSGGGDSTALLAMLASRVQLYGRALFAGIVDHGLREGSAADCARAAQMAEAFGARPIVMRLEWPHGPRRAQAAARTARYGALAKIARDVGTRTVFLGHTLDDQAETSLMRGEAGSGSRGLAAMAVHSPCPIWPEGRDLMLARPLLSLRRAALREQLREAGIAWLEDPANDLPRYARTRARAELGLDTTRAERLATEAAAHAEAARSTDERAQAWLHANVRLAQDQATLRTEALEDAGAARALCVLAATIGGALREPGPAAVAELVARLRAGKGATLAGARFRPGPFAIVSRDPGGVFGRRGGGAPLAPLPLPAGESVVWDRRLALTAAEPGWVAAPPARGERLEPRLLPPAGASGVTQHWLVKGRIERLLWRANCSLFTAP